MCRLTHCLIFLVLFSNRYFVICIPFDTSVLLPSQSLEIRNLRTHNINGFAITSCQSQDSTSLRLWNSRLLISLILLLRVAIDLIERYNSVRRTRSVSSLCPIVFFLYTFILCSKSYEVAMLVLFCQSIPQEYVSNSKIGELDNGGINLVSTDSKDVIAAPMLI